MANFFRGFTFFFTSKEDMEMPKSGPFKMFLLASVFAMPFMAGAAFASDDVNALVDDGRFYADFRYRYEHVEQGNRNEKANASTLRTKLGFETGEYKDIKALLELEHSGNLGSEEYNDTVNGKTAFPVVADPDGLEFNQAWITWGGLPDTSLKLGRQGINIDNQRFIGTVGWRQNDQTFDSVMVTNTSLPDTTLAYSYIWNVNRINGEDHPLGDLRTETHIMHAAYQAMPWLNITAYDYLLDVDLAAALSTNTYGVRLTGAYDIDEAFNFFYTGEWASQSDTGSNQANYDVDYFHVSPGIKWEGWSFQAGFESLEGNGTSSFQTPLATLHAHNGWADLFLTTPANGLEDLYMKASYKVSGTNTLLDKTKLDLAYHDFSPENTGSDYGDEWDAQIARSFDGPDFMKKWSLALKYAAFDGEPAAGFPDVQKYWITVGVKF